MLIDGRGEGLNTSYFFHQVTWLVSRTAVHFYALKTFLSSSYVTLTLISGCFFSLNNACLAKEKMLQKGLR